MDISANDRRRDFSIWLRTGRWPPRREAVEVKFNPWHDPADGRFTFAGSGNYHGAGGAGSANRASDRATADRDNPWKPRPSTRLNSASPRARQAAGYGKKPVAEFVGGVGEGLRDVAEGTVAGARSALTTNPVTTARTMARGIAARIDTAIAADDKPARAQILRAAETVANASARDIGRATGSVAGSTALAAVPGAAIAKVSKLRSLRAAQSRPTFDPPQIGWVKENLGKDTPAKRYNDAADGARPGQAPTLMRTMPDGSKRPVKFDGVRGDYLIDRKFGVSGKPRSVAQLLRQSEVLAQHRSISILEVPTAIQRKKAIKVLKRHNITNMYVKVVEP